MNGCLDPHTSSVPVERYDRKKGLEKENLIRLADASHGLTKAYLTVGLTEAKLKGE
jgi:hypothetical protein